MSNEVLTKVGNKAEWAAGGTGGGGGCTVLRVSAPSGDPVSMDKTFAELLETIESGKNVECFYETMDGTFHMSLTYHSTEGIIFSTVVTMGGKWMCIGLTIGNDGAMYKQSGQLSIKQ